MKPDEIRGLASNLQHDLGQTRDAQEEIAVCAHTAAIMLIEIAAQLAEHNDLLRAEQKLKYGAYGIPKVGQA